MVYDGMVREGDKTNLLLDDGVSVLRRDVRAGFAYFVAGSSVVCQLSNSVALTLGGDFAN